MAPSFEPSCDPYSGPSSKPVYARGLVWFRRDLRAQDQAALYRALTQCQQVHCAFVFDREILDALPRVDRRVAFIQQSLVELDATLRTLSGHWASAASLCRPCNFLSAWAKRGSSACSRAARTRVDPR